MSPGGAPPGPRRFWTQVLGGVRGRLLALVAAATIPIAAIAVNNAWSAFRAAGAAGLRDAVILREVAAARHGAAMEGLREILTNLARSRYLLALPADACDQHLRHLRELAPDRYSNFWLLDGEGRLLCSGLPARRGDYFAELDYVREIRQSKRFVLGQFTLGLVSGRAVLPAAAPVLDEAGQLQAIVGGSLFLDFFLRGGQATPNGDQNDVWLLDADGSVLPLGSARAEALPPREDLPQMLAAQEMSLVGTARGGTPYAWSMAVLDPGLRVLAGVSLAQAKQGAWLTFARRLLELSLFLAACLVAILIGVELGVSRPLRRLVARVREWAPGRIYEADPQAQGPYEVRELDQALVGAARALREREAALTHALHQRDLLMAEIHHRVKNNLQVVASLLNLQADRLRNPSAQAEFAVARDRVQALATLHRHLYLHQSFERISMRPFLDELSRQLGDALGAGPDSGVRIDIDTEDLEMGSDQAISLALLLTEAVSNAMRHGFPEGRAGRILISLHVEGDTAHLVVEDDGVGLDDAADGNSDGLGMRLIEGFAGHLGGEAEITGEQGTRIAVRFPLHRRDIEASARDGA
ncbi:sensor histidine kinase [Neoroseomonas terrae]|uniref:sensor histidine kinase n=1 Tax=Neoroseomonas terrae TaxID=424799 RepID=UPI001BADA76C